MSSSKPVLELRLLNTAVQNQRHLIGSAVNCLIYMDLLGHLRNTQVEVTS
jgi:predicted RNA-binding protein (virulence factor B family)